MPESKLDYMLDADGNIFWYGTHENVLRPRQTKVIDAALNNELRATRTVDVLILDARGSDR